jgi:putative peptidoglycan lipid II flippase
MNFSRALFTISSLTVVSRVGGFIRDTLIAMILGAGPVADAFFVAQRLPNLFRGLFVEGAFSSVFVPLYTAERHKNGHESAQRFAGQSLSLLLGVVIPISLLAMVFMPVLVRMIAPGFEHDPEKFDLTVNFSTIAFPYLGLISITALQGGVLNALGKFAATSAVPIMLNIVMIAALLLAYIFHLQTGYALSWAFLAGGAVQMIWLAVSCHRAGVSIPLVLPWAGNAGRKLFRLLGPNVLGAGAWQINLLFSYILASLLPTGAISYLFYADRLEQLPLGIIGIAVGTTLLPLLSHHVESGDEDHVRHYTSRGIEFCLLLGLPATMGLILTARPIVQTLFEHGVFSHADTIATAGALAAYACGIPSYLLVKVFSTAFYARRDVMTPVKAATITVVVNIACAALLLFPLHHVGIALATSISIWVNAALLFFRLRDKKYPFDDARLRTHIPRLLACVLGMSVVTLGLVRATESWFVAAHVGFEIVGLAVIIGVSGVVYGLLLHVTGIMRWREVLFILKRKPAGEEGPAERNGGTE